jgi:hypothetical protein
MTTPERFVSVFVAQGIGVVGRVGQADYCRAQVQAPGTCALPVTIYRD